MRREAAPRVRIDASQTLGGFLPQSHRPDRHPFDIELVTPERGRFSDYDNDNDNDNDYDYDYDYDNGMVLKAFSDQVVLRMSEPFLTVC